MEKQKKPSPLEEFLDSLPPEERAQLMRELPFIVRRVRYMRLIVGGKKDPPSDDLKGEE